MKKIAIAMSGGVDSGVAAALLIRKGYQCEGFHLKLWSECPSFESLEFVQKTAQKLGIPLHLVDLTEVFKKKVVDEFLKDYASGLTPNPCIFCNKFIKFGELLAYVQKLGFDYLATGHYARTKSDTQNVIRNTQDVKRKTKKNVSRFTYHVLRARDEQKDQSYFLYNLTQCQLKHVLFPIGDYQKKEVVALAKKWQLPVATRPESQEICFLSEDDYRPFLKRHISSKIIPGEVVDVKGKFIGKHLGLPLYTIGQRHGFEIRTKNIEHRTKEIIPPFYVIRKNIKKNQLIVGFGKETERKEFLVKNLNWLNPNYQSLIADCQLLVRIRHQGELLRCKISLMVRTIEPKYVRVVLDESERGIAPGQSAVFYLGEEVLGGGIIAN